MMGTQVETQNPLSEKPFVLDKLHIDLEHRVHLMEIHRANLLYVCRLLRSFAKDVPFILQFSMPISMISNQAFNIINNLIVCLIGITEYDYLNATYLLKDDYNNNYRLWKYFNNYAKDVEKVISKIEKENIFNSDEAIADDLLAVISENGKSLVRPLLVLDHKLSKINGDGLLHALIVYMRDILRRLEIIKTGIYNLTDADFEKIYQANLKLYLDVYWPKEKDNFRNTIELNYLKGKKNKKDILEWLLLEEKSDFSKNETGLIWRESITNKKTLYFKMKYEVGLSEAQWKYFFKNICRFAAYEQWIEELSNPPESDEDKQKRERLLKSNKIFNLKPTKLKKEVDIFLLYTFIKTRFICEKMHVYDWFALYYILYRNGLLLPCTVEDFVRQMNHNEWFAHVETKCSANEINTYRFLKDKSPDNWSNRFKPTGSRATKKSVENLYRKYSDLEDTIDEIYVIE